jgi:hypothetical protein
MWVIAMNVVICFVDSFFAKEVIVITVKRVIVMNAIQLVAVIIVTNHAAFGAMIMAEETSCTAYVLTNHFVPSASPGEKILFHCVRTVLLELIGIWMDVCGDEVQTTV